MSFLQQPASAQSAKGLHGEHASSQQQLEALITQIYGTVNVPCKTHLLLNSVKAQNQFAFTAEVGERAGMLWTGERVKGESVTERDVIDDTDDDMVSQHL